VPEPDFVIREGDTLADLVDTVRDAAGEPVAINGADVTLLIAPLAGGEALYNGPAENLDVDGTLPNRGKVRFAEWTSLLTNTPAHYLAQWTVTFANGDVLTFPNAGYIWIEITADPPLAPGRYVTLEELKATRELKDESYADRDLIVAIASAADALDEEYGGPWDLGAVSEARYFTPAHGLTYVTLHPPLVSPASGAGAAEVALDTTLLGAYARELVHGVDYVLEPASGPPFKRLRFLRSGVAWDWEYDPHLDPYPWGRDGLRITGQWGYADTPAGVKAAATILATRIFLRMRDAPFGVLGVGPEGTTVRTGDIARDPEIRALMKQPAAPKPLIV
jgi:hypothetical protein